MAVRGGGWASPAAAVLAVWAAFATVAAATEIALPGQRCEIPPLEAWHRGGGAEAWAWNQLCAGRVADFNHRHARKLAPLSAEGWTPERRLSRDFLVAVLTHPRFADKIPHRQVIIRGALFDDDVDLEGVTVAGELWLEQSRFQESVKIAGARFARSLSLDGSTIVGELDGRDARVDGTVYLGSGSRYGAVNLINARIAGDLDLESAEVTQHFNLDRARVNGTLFLRSKPGGAPARFANVNLIAATILGNVDLSGAVVSGEVTLDRTTVGQSLQMHRVDMTQPPRFATVKILGSTIGSNLELSGAQVTRGLLIEAVRVGGSVWLNDSVWVRDEGSEFARLQITHSAIALNLEMAKAKFGGPVSVTFTEIGSQMIARQAVIPDALVLRFSRMGEADLTGASLSKLNLTGAAIERELRFGSGDQPILWTGESSVTLTDARIGVFVDHPDSWIDNLAVEFGGLTVGRLGGPAAAEMPGRPAEWFANLLRRDRTFSMQPYEHLAQVLRAAGRGDKANDVLYSGREREREVAWNRGEWLQWTSLTFLSATIGYGVGPDYYVRTVFWVVVFIAIGYAFLRLTGEHARHGIPLGFAYSVDMLLPIIRLRDKHYDVDLNPPARYYFYVHKIAGYVLASFLVAGLSGITK